MTTISAVTRNQLSCCAGGADIGAGMLWLLGLALPAGGDPWDIITIVTGRSNR